MLRRQRQIRTQLNKLIDAALFAIALWLAHWLRVTLPFEVFGGTRSIFDFYAYQWLFLIIVPFAPLILETQGFYNRPWMATMRQTFFPLLKACSLMVLLLISSVWLFRQSVEIARSVIIYFGLVSFLLILGKEEMVRLSIIDRVGKSRLKRKLILVGTEEDTELFHREIKTKSQEGIEIKAQINLNEDSLEKLVALLHDHSVNGVVISAKHTLFGQVEKAIQACELEGVEVWLLADFFKTQISQTTVDDFYGRPMMVFRSTPEASWQGVAKEILDVVGAAVLLLLTSPLLIGIALAIRMSSSGPVLFRQKRSGLNGEPFTMLKFRSMVSDAEQRKQELAALNEMIGPVFKVSADPRITRVGRFIRKYSLDEFPQLINVLRGEMSLVGPRPLPVDEVLNFDDLAHRRRLSVKPGLTCLWQISGRNNVTDFQTWVSLDLEYIDNWSFWLDLKILIRTIPVVLLGTGAK